MKNNLLLLFAIWLTVLKEVFCGKIYGTDIQVSYPIAGQATQYNFKIMLETILKTTDYLRIKFPYQLEYLVGKDEVVLTISDGTLTDTTSSLTIVDNIYHFQILFDLLPYNWYTIKLVGVINFLNPQTSGFQNPVGIATVTSLLSDAMTIDNNPIFSTFVLTDSPPTAMTVSANYVPLIYDSVKYIQGQQYEVILTIRATRNVTSSDSDHPSGVKYKIFLTDASFKFVNPTTCIIPDRPTGECSCDFFGGTTYQVLVQCLSDLVITGSNTYKEIKIQLFVINSMQVISNSQGFSVQLIYPPTQLIVETGQITNFFKVNVITLSNMSLKLLHGIPYSSGFATSFEAPVGIYIPSTRSPVFQPFNSVRIIFQLSKSTSPAIKLKVVAFFNSAEAILESSILHNLPQFDTSFVKCGFDYSNRQIVCNGVGPLITGTSYFIAARIALTSAATTVKGSDNQTYIQNFGGIQVFSVLTDSTGAQFFGQVTDLEYPFENIPVYQQSEYTDYTVGGNQQLKNFQNNIICSGSTTGTFATAISSNLNNGANVGIIPISSPQRLIFYVRITQQQQSYQDQLGYRQASYMKLIYNDQLITISSSNLNNGIEISGTASTNGFYQVYGSGSVNNRIYQQNDLAGANLFKYAYLLITTSKPVFDAQGLAFGMQNAQFPASFVSSQFVADDRILDFLVFFMHKDPSSTSTNQLVTHSTMLIHGYTIYSSYINSNFEAMFTNVYKYNKVVNNGYKIPTLLRLYGQLTALEIKTASTANLKLAIIPDRSVQQFFAVNQAQFISGTTTLQGCGGTTEKCYSYEDGKSFKIQNPADNWQFNPFLLLDLPSVTSQVNAALPLLLRQSVTPMTLNIAIVGFTTTGALEVYNVVRVYGASLGLNPFTTANRFYYDINVLVNNANTWDSVADYTNSAANLVTSYKIQSVSSITPSQSVSSMVFLSTHTDTSSAISVNVLATFKLGAGFTISSYKQDYFDTSTLTGFPGTSALAKCISKFKYQVSTISTPYFNYIVHCPYDNSAYTDGAAGVGMTFSSFPCPSYWAATFPLINTFVYAWSSNSGQLMAMQSEVQSTAGTSIANGCIVSAFASTYYLAMERQEMVFTVTPSINAILNEVSDLYAVKLTFNAFPTGVTFQSQCYANTVATATSNIYPDFTQCIVRKTAAGVITFFINKISDEDGVIVQFSPTKAFTITFYLTHLGVVTTAQTFTSKIYFNTYAQDTCNSGGTVNVAAGTAFAGGSSISVMTISNLVIDNPTAKSNTRIQFQFNYVGRDSIPNTTIRFKLGFLSTPAMLQNLDCRVLETTTYTDYAPLGVSAGSVTGLMPSSKFSTVSISTLTSSIDIIMRDAYPPPTIPFEIECFGFKAPNGVNTQSFSAEWVDTENSGTLIQKTTTNIQYTSMRFFTAKTIPSTRLKLISKYFNTVGFSGVYTIQFLPKYVRMTVDSRIYVEFSLAYTHGLVRKGNNPMCLLNSMKVTCIQDPTTPRRLTIYPLTLKTTTLEPNKIYTLVIAGIVQPQSLDAYGQIWFGIDADFDLSNGLQEQGDIPDINISSTKVAYLQDPSLAYSSNKIRQSRVMLSLNFTCSSRTITNNRYAFLEIDPSFFNSQIDKFESNIECDFYRIGDSTRTNLTTSCERIYGNSFIRMNLTLDSYNTKHSASYWIQIFYLPSPDYENTNSFPIFISFFIADKNMNSVLYAVNPALTKTSTIIKFIEPPQTTKTLMWYKFDNKPLAQKKSLLYEQYPGRDKHLYVDVIRGLISTDIVYLSIEQGLYFNQDFRFNFTNITVFNLFNIYVGKEFLTSNQVLINTGDDGVKMAIASKVSTPIGIYTLEMKKQGTFTPFEDPDISPIPNLVIRVVDTICNLALSSTAISTPQGSQSPQIILDFSSCLPSEDIVVIANFNPQPLSSSEIFILNQASQIINVATSTQASYYLYVDPSVPLAATYTLEITMTGVNSKQYNLPINQVAITVVAPSSYITPVVVSAHTQTLSTDQSTLTLSTKCNQNGFVFWSIAVGETYLNGQQLIVDITGLQIRQKIYFLLPSSTASLSDILINKRYKIFNWQNSIDLSEEEIYLARQYGYAKIAANTATTLTFNDLPQRNIFTLSYYCLSEFFEFSDVHQTQFTTSWRLDSSNVKVKDYKHLRIDLTFSGNLTDSQLNSLECQLQKYFTVNSYSLALPNCRVCDQSASYSYTQASYQDLSTSTSSCPIKSTTTPTKYSLYAWSGEQSNGRTIDLSNYIQSLYSGTSCLFVLIINQSYDLEMITSFTNTVQLTPIIPDASSQLLPQLSQKGFVKTSTNVTISVESTASQGFLIIGAHHYQRSNSTSTSDSNEEVAITLTHIPYQPSYLSLRQGYFGDFKTEFNLYRKIEVIQQNVVHNVTIEIEKGQEYVFYWTLATMESCGDSLYTPMGYEHFLFSDNLESKMLSIGILNAILIICMLLL